VPYQYALLPGEFEPTQFDLRTAAEQMRAMREEASTTAQAVKLATSELKKGVADAATPLQDLPAQMANAQTLDSAQAVVAAQQTAALETASTTGLEGAFEPLSQGAEMITRTALADPRRMNEALRAMGRDFIASMVRSHAEALVGGAEKGSLLSAIYGERGRGGGLTGLAQRYLFGATEGPGPLGPSGELVGANGLAAPLAGYGAELGEQGSEQLQALSDNFSQLNSSLSGLPETFDQLGTSTSELPELFQSLAGSFNSALGELASLGGGGIGGLGSLFSGLGDVGAIFGFERGGIVPSAAGGMIVGPGHGTLAMLHPREMVLPAHLSTGIQRLIGDATGPTASHNINVNYHVSALDARSVRELLMEHGDTITNILQRSLRASPRGGSGFVIS